MPQDARALLHQNRLDEAIAAQVEVVRSKPGEAEARALLAEFLCLSGQWERADKQLDLIGTQQPGLAVGVALFRQLIRGAMAREEERLVAHVKFLRKPPTRRGDTNAGRIAWIANEVARSGAKVFVADLLDRVLPEDEVKDEARAWKEIANAAQQTGSAFLVVHQQRLKDVEQRPDKRPTREGVKGSAAIVEASDTLIGWHRRGLWKAVEDTAVEAIVLKQKRGKWPLAVEFDWDPKRASLRNGREVKYLRPGEEGSDVDGFIDRMQRGRGGRSGR